MGRVIPFRAVKKVSGDRVTYKADFDELLFPNASYAEDGNRHICVVTIRSGENAVIMLILIIDGNDETLIESEVMFEFRDFKISGPCTKPGCKCLGLGNNSVVPLLFRPIEIFKKKSEAIKKVINQEDIGQLFTDRCMFRLMDKFKGSFALPSDFTQKDRYAKLRLKILLKEEIIDIVTRGYSLQSKRVLTIPFKTLFEKAVAANGISDLTRESREKADILYKELPLAWFYYSILLNARDDEGIFNFKKGIDALTLWLNREIISSLDIDTQDVLWTID